MAGVFRRLPNWTAVILSEIVALLSAVLVGVLSGITAASFYAAKGTKDDALGVLLFVFLAVAGFVFVFVGTWLLSRRGNATSQSSSIAVVAWLVTTTYVLSLAARDLGSLYYKSIFIGWLMTVVALFAAWLLSYKFLVRRSAVKPPITNLPIS